MANYWYRWKSAQATFNVDLSPLTATYCCTPLTNSQVSDCASPVIYERSPTSHQPAQPSPAQPGSKKQFPKHKKPRPWQMSALKCYNYMTKYIKTSILTLLKRKGQNHIISLASKSKQWWNSVSVNLYIWLNYLIYHERGELAGLGLGPRCILNL